MARIILIETSTSLCSIGLSEDGFCTHYKESPEPRAHAAMTAPYIKEVLDEAGLRVRDCDAVCVSKGPGSYTGLRVGSSTAKGLSFGAGIPLIALGTLDILVAQARAVIPGLDPGISAPAFIIPMIDARRMEVYTAVFSPSGEQLTPTVSTVVTPDSFAEQLAAGPVIFIGDGALKCCDTLSSPAARFIGECPRASSMAALAEAAFRAGRFEDTAYFEPFYLKDFVATLPRKTLF